MCGIIGYIGNENASELVFKGLKRLEYRGYDSWGIAIKNGNEIFSKKCVGAIGDAEYTFPKSMVAIAHTRWATHGNVSEINAHPHFCCKKHIAVVHNGIIENDIKNEIKNYAQKIWDIFKFKGAVRIDLRLKDNKPYFLEVNTIPGLTRRSLLPLSAQGAGISFEDLIHEILLS
ncbi:MAG TPA: hypothetical protein EYP08_01040 [Pyrodictiaceae archaeon]|nr:hypothetical protein [Pyrodictiaceae archaeon]